MATREKLIAAVKCVNKNFTKEWMKKQTNEVVLANCHPSERAEFEYLLEKETPVQEED